MPIQYTANFSAVNNEKNSVGKNSFIFAQNIDCGYMLELPQQGDSNEYPQSMCKSKKKNMNTCSCTVHPLQTPVLLRYPDV